MQSTARHLLCYYVTFTQTWLESCSERLSWKWNTDCWVSRRHRRSAVGQSTHNSSSLLLSPKRRWAINIGTLYCCIVSYKILLLNVAILPLAALYILLECVDALWLFLTELHSLFFPCIFIVNCSWKKHLWINLQSILISQHVTTSKKPCFSIGTIAKFFYRIFQITSCHLWQLLSTQYTSRFLFFLFGGVA